MQGATGATSGEPQPRRALRPKGPTLNAILGPHEAGSTLPTWLDIFTGKLKQRGVARRTDAIASIGRWFGRSARHDIHTFYGFGELEIPPSAVPLPLPDSSLYATSEHEPPIRAAQARPRGRKDHAPNPTEPTLGLDRR